MSYSDEYDEYEDEPPLYRAGELAGMDEARLRQEWRRQCGIHDHGVDSLPLGHPTIETAQACMNLVEAEQKRRGFDVGPGDQEPW